MTNIYHRVQAAAFNWQEQGRQMIVVENLLLRAGAAAVGKASYIIYNM